MNLDDFMAELRSHPEYFQVIAQDGGPPSIVMSDPRTDQQVAQYSVPDVTGYRYSDGFQAQMPSGEGDRISVANPDKRPTVQQLQEMWSRSQLPGSGVSFDQYMRETGAKVDASGRVDQTISKDWGFGGGSIWDAIVDLGPKALALYGGVTGLESLVGGAASASGGAASGATGAFDTFGALNSPTGLGAGGTVLDAAAAAAPATGALASAAPAATEAAAGALPGGASTIPGYGTFDPFTAGVTNSGLPAATGASTIPGSTLGTAAPFTSGLLPASSSAGTAALQAWEAGTPSGSIPSTPASAPSTPAPSTTTTTAPPPIDGEGGMIPGEYKDLGGTMSPFKVALRNLFGGTGGAGGIDWGKLLAGGAGVVGSMYATDKYDKLARDAMDMMGGDALKNARKSALTRYETNAASPSAFLEDPWVKSALDYSTEARNRALSRTMPTAGNPAAETDIQKNAISSLFGNLMLPYRQQLANEAGIASAPAQAAQLATSIGGKAIDSSMQGWNSAGYGLSGVTGSGSGNSTNILDLINGFGNLAKTVGV